VTDTPQNPYVSQQIELKIGVITFVILDKNLQTLLSQRSHGPFRDAWAIPEQKIELNEDLHETALRELSGKVSDPMARIQLEQLGAYGSPERDPRGRTVTVAFWTVIPNFEKFTDVNDLLDVQPIKVSDIENGSLKMAFDHNEIFADAIENLRSKMESTSVAANFFDSPFTLSEFRNVYEAAWKTKINAGNFQRKIQQTENFLIPTGEKAPPDSSGGRPADLFLKGLEKKLDPPLKRK